MLSLRLTTRTDDRLPGLERAASDVAVVVWDEGGVLSIVADDMVENEKALERFGEDESSAPLSISRDDDEEEAAF